MLPALIVLTIGTMDICSMIFLRESAVIAAYEGARRGVPRNRTNDDAIERALEVLNERGVDHGGAGSITIGGTGFDVAETLENVTITVNVPARGNLLIASQMFDGMIVSASVTMRKEYKNLQQKLMPRPSPSIF